MPTSSPPIAEQARAKQVFVLGGLVLVKLVQGSTLAFPAADFPQLRNASPAQLEAVTLRREGAALRWDELDEDLLVSRLVEQYDTEPHRQRLPHLLLQQL